MAKGDLRLVAVSSSPMESKLRPLHLAKFYVGRGAPETDAEWHAALEAELKVICESSGDCVRRYDGSSAFVVHGRFTLELDRERAMFWLADHTLAIDADSPHGYPSEFLSRAYSMDLAPDAQRLVGVARKLWNRMSTLFNHSLNNGKIEIYARPDSPLSEFRRIMPDQWGWFKLKREEDDEGWPIIRIAEGPNGEVLYNPHFKRRSSDATPEVTGPISRRRECTDALVQIIMTRPDLPMTKDEIGEWARSQFGMDFPKADIDNCRRKAIAVAKPNTWDRPGRRPKSPE